MLDVCIYILYLTCAAAAAAGFHTRRKRGGLMETRETDGSLPRTSPARRRPQTHSSRGTGEGNGSPARRPEARGVVLVLNGQRRDFEWDSFLFFKCISAARDGENTYIWMYFHPEENRGCNVFKILAYWHGFLSFFHRFFLLLLLLFV